MVKKKIKKKPKFKSTELLKNNIKDYRFDSVKRKNIPSSGLASFDKGKIIPKTYKYDPHLDPQLQWTGKEERVSFDVDTVSLHIHETISAKAILDAVRKKDIQRTLFEEWQLPLDKAIEFYQHDVTWKNRLILGDSLIVMNSFLEKELMAGKVQCIYIDPPYGIKYSSNFMPSTRQQVVRDEDKSLTREPEQIKAYRDTWKLDVHSYLTYLRDRILLAKDLLSESGSIFVQIGDDNVHHVRELLDEIFGPKNFIAAIAFKKTGGLSAKFITTISDTILWYAKNKEIMKYRPLYLDKQSLSDLNIQYNWVELPNGKRRKMTKEELLGFVKLPTNSKIFKPDNPTSAGNPIYEFEFKGRKFSGSYKTTKDGMQRLADANRLISVGNGIWYVRFLDDFPVSPLTNIWLDTSSSFQKRLYVVQTTTKPIGRCILMATDPGDLVLDPTCGSGTTAYVCEQWGRRWITIDTSRVALALARMRLMTASFPYYKLENPEMGPSGGFVYTKVPHVTLGSIAQNEPSKTEDLYDRPEIDKEKVRISGPFTVESIPIYSMVEEDKTEQEEFSATTHIQNLIELLRKNGVTLPNKKHISFLSLNPLGGSGFIHAEGEYKENGNKPVKVAVSFGPRYGPVTVIQIEDTLHEAIGGYDVLLFAGFSFDPEAQSFIQKSPTRKLKLLFAHIAPDVLVEDLLKAPKKSQLFTVFGEPDIKVFKKDDKYIVEIAGIDFYDPVKGETYSGDQDDIAAWFLDQDYDKKTFLVCQAFFPQKGKNPWKKLEITLKGRVDKDKFQQLMSLKSVQFKAGKNKRIAVKVIDHRGTEVVSVIDLAKVD